MEEDEIADAEMDADLFGEVEHSLAGAVFEISSDEKSRLQAAALEHAKDIAEVAARTEAANSYFKEEEGKAKKALKQAAISNVVKLRSKTKAKTCLQLVDAQGNGVNAGTGAGAGKGA